jgi:glycine cleavage system H protein
VAAVLRQAGPVRRGEPIAEIASGSHRLTVASPVDGLLRKTNRTLRWWPRLVAQDPYVRGWIAEVEPGPDDHGSFLTGRTARGWFEDEGRRLNRFFEGQLGLQATDGGEPITVPATTLSDEQWRQAAREFLGAA